jgi:hypothetical protein
MRILFALLISAAMACAAGQAAKKPASGNRAKAAPAKAAQPKPAVFKPVVIPPDAEEVKPGTFRHKGADGKTWFYKKTPFGVSRWEDTGETKPKKELGAGYKVREDGDIIHFERATPMGMQKWDVKKTELNEKERAAWERERARAGNQD